MSEKTAKQEHDDFETPTRSEFIAKVGDKERKYFIDELTWDDAQNLAEVIGKGDTDEEKAAARRQATPRWIAASVKREDGTAVTIEEATRFRAHLAQQFEHEILRLNGFTKEAATAAKKE